MYITGTVGVYSDWVGTGRDFSRYSGVRIMPGFTGGVHSNWIHRWVFFLGALGRAFCLCYPVGTLLGSLSVDLVGTLSGLTSGYSAGYFRYYSAWVHRWVLVDLVGTLSVFASRILPAHHL